MPNLTDEQIVRRIAKFMGWDGIAWHAISGLPGFHGTDLQTGKHNQRIPPWTTSYDAIAPVYEKIGRELCGPWFKFKPRDHAEAIAVALGGEE